MLYKLACGILLFLVIWNYISQLVVSNKIWPTPHYGQWFVGNSGLWFEMQSISGKICLKPGCRDCGTMALLRRHKHYLMMSRFKTEVSCTIILRSGIQDFQLEEQLLLNAQFWYRDTNFFSDKKKGLYFTLIVY